jgi:hypothetical protein
MNELNEAETDEIDSVNGIHVIATAIKNSQLCISTNLSFCYIYLEL